MLALEAIGVRVPRAWLTSSRRRASLVHEVHEYKRIVEAAQKLDPRIHLLGGSAGLRRGEIIALKCDRPRPEATHHPRASLHLVGEGARASRDGATFVPGSRGNLPLW
jgi:hypothetical protein